MNSAVNPRSSLAGLLAAVALLAAAAVLFHSCRPGRSGPPSAPTARPKASASPSSKTPAARTTPVVWASPVTDETPPPPAGPVAADAAVEKLLDDFQAAFRAKDPARWGAAEEALNRQGVGAAVQVARRALAANGEEMEKLKWIVYHLVGMAALPPLPGAGGSASPGARQPARPFGQNDDQAIEHCLARLPLEVALVYCYESYDEEYHRGNREAYRPPSPFDMWNIHKRSHGDPEHLIRLMPLENMPIPSGGGALARWLQEAAAPPLRAAAALALPPDEASTALLCDRLAQDEAPQVRWAAAMRMGTVADRRLFAPLVRALREDREAIVRRAAARSLGILGALERRAAADEGAGGAKSGGTSTGGAKSGGTSTGGAKSGGESNGGGGGDSNN